MSNLVYRSQYVGMTLNPLETSLLNLFIYGKVEVVCCALFKIFFCIPLESKSQLLFAFE